MSCSLVLAPPTLNTMTATHAVQPIIIIMFKLNVLIFELTLLYSLYLFYMTCSS
jgi:hypothetical protein